MIARHLPVLQVIVPLIAAPVCVLLRRRSWCWTLTVLVCLIALGISIGLLSSVLDGGPIVYELGNWPAPWGIEYRVDALNAFVLVLIGLMGAGTAIYALASIGSEIDAGRHHLFYAVYLLNFTGVLGMTITGDAFNVYVFLEITSLSSYALVSLGRDRRALTGAFRYLVLGTVGATFFLIGIGLMYMMTGTLNMADLAERLQPMLGTRTALAALAFLTVGLTLKLALFPLHAWLPDAYTYAPSVVSIFLAATTTKVSIYVFLRFAFTVWGADFVFAAQQIQAYVLPLALAGIFYASLVAMAQSNVKRLLAYSSIAQVGYIVLGICFASVTGLAGAIVHLFNHALTKAALFMAVGAVALRVGAVNLDAMRGLGRRMPLTMAAFVAAGLSLIGLPLTVGFVSKWTLVLAALEAGWWPVAWLMLLSSMLSVAYVWRVVEAAYFQPPADRAIREAPMSMQIPLWLLTAAIVVFGIWTPLTAGIARQAAQWLLGEMP